MEFAAFCENPPAFTISSTALLTKVQKLGLAYEKRVQAYVSNLCRGDAELDCLHNPWIMFRRKGEPLTVVNFCQPDCLVVNRSERKVIVVEIKLSHTQASWQQLRQLYEPILRKLYRHNTSFSFVEICKWLDPHKAYPETFYYEEFPLQALPDKIAIHIYKPRGRGKLNARSLAS